VTTISSDLHVGSGLSVTGVSTFSNTVVGGATTELVVGGDARITGILTIGTGSVTIDGTSGSSSITGVSTAGIGSVYGVDSINDLGFPTTGPLSNRNLVHNGAMAIAQRGAGPVTVTVDGEYLIDRFKTYSSTFNTYSVDQSQDTDVPAGQGFQYSYKLRVSANAAGTPAFGYVLLGYSFEGYDINQLEYGNANCKTVAVSFWVKSSVAGTYGFCFRNSTATKNYTGEYSIQAANTWEYKTFTIPGADSGTFESTNGKGLEILMGIDVGTTFHGTANTWHNSNLFGTPGMTNTWSDTLNNDFYVTGLQVEVGTKSTPFERRSYGDDLQKCMRYFQMLPNGVSVTRSANGVAYSDARLEGSIVISRMRAAPTTRASDGSATISTGMLNVNYGGETNAELNFIVTSGSSTHILNPNYKNTNNANNNLGTGFLFGFTTEDVYISAEL
jgi:hypothetical protein